MTCVQEGSYADFVTARSDGMEPTFSVRCPVVQLVTPQLADKRSNCLAMSQAEGQSGYQPEIPPSFQWAIRPGTLQKVLINVMENGFSAAVLLLKCSVRSFFFSWVVVHFNKLAFIVI